MEQQRKSSLCPENSGVPPDYFVIKLYQMLTEQSEEVISWDPEGGIVIQDRERLESTLSIYFRHNRFTSFQRQLNNFGFHKKRKDPIFVKGGTRRKGAAYGHPLLFGKSAEAVLRLRRDMRPVVKNELLETLADVAASALLDDRRLLQAKQQQQQQQQHQPRSRLPSSSSLSSSQADATCSYSSDEEEDDESDEAVAVPLPPSRAPRRARPFPCVLRDMIEQSPDDVLRWSEDGFVFVVANAQVLSNVILPNFFRHCRLASFQRQLSLYQFRRARVAKNAGCLAYYHVLFVRGADDEQLRCITRVSSSKQPQRPQQRQMVPLNHPKQLSYEEDDDEYPDEQAYANNNKRMRYSSSSHYDQVYPQNTEHGWDGPPPPRPCFDGNSHQGWSALPVGKSR